MRKLTRILSAVIILFFTSQALAWNPPVDTAGPLTLRIGDVGVVKELEKPIPVEITITNSAATPVSGTVALSVIDRWRIQGDSSSRFIVKANDSTTLPYHVIPGKGTYSALYPIHARAAFQHGKEKLQAHAVLIVRTEVPHQPLPVSEITTVRSAGPLPLWTLRNHRVEWNYFGKEKHRQPIGWSGTDPECRCSFTIVPGMRRGDQEMPALAMHSPWVGGPGTIFVEYLLSLPQVQPIRLLFRTAIRDNAPQEPPSDGVTFRVWAGEEKVFERHSDSKRWLKAEVDLSSFAGKTIVLRLESHPGPRNDTTCDSAYWGSPMLIVGDMPEMETQEEIENRMRAEAEEVVQAAREVIRRERKPVPGLFFFRLRRGEHTCLAAVKLGKYGLFDAIVAFVWGDRELVMYGLNVNILDAAPLDPLSGLTVADVRSSTRNGVLEIVHRLQGRGKAFDLTGEIRGERDALKITVNCPQRITDVAPGPFSHKAARVYAGMGNVIVRPSAFTLSGDGHHLSTSHVGADFENGVSLLEAVSVPPDVFRVDPDRKVCALHTHLNGTLTLLPSTQGAFEAALGYRDVVKLSPSAGVPGLAGRFVFDVWGGRGYRQTAEALRQAIRYGMTDAVLIYHNWQRWGYDYRLPDIFPPNPARGTLAEFQEMAAVCRDAGILFAPHDNYIDFYPDAAQYTYEAIAFSADNRPVRAWYNRGRDAQSYRFRPDRFQPFILRNVQLMKRNVQPTAYFIDVFSSLMPFDYYDWDGRFHPKTETQSLWGETFNFVRDYLGDNAPQISESGHDSLIGSLDGATCNHLRVDAKSKEWSVWRIACQDAERTPWYDAVHRHRFILHGAGYSGRYQAGLDARNHGIDSDDYVSTEVLDGHPGMVSTPVSRSAVRKYWLLQDVMRKIALKPVTGVAFVDGDIHRQLITYRGGEAFFVNRGDADWEVSGHVLPQYGFFAGAGVVEAAVEKRDGIIVDWCSSPSSLYVNARRVDHRGRLASQNPDDPRFNPDGKIVDFGAVRTNGAFRLTRDNEGMTLTPLPAEGAFAVEIAVTKIAGRGVASIRKVAALDESGKTVAPVDFTYARGKLSFEADGTAFAYRATW